jgi:hypothetical protein
VDGTGSGSCLVAGIVEPSGYVTRVSKLVREINCEGGKWMELAKDRVQWRALVLAELNLRVMLPLSCYVEVCEFVF